jgi:3-deoxy-D-manno-octulosonic-acid transferase
MATGALILLGLACCAAALAALLRRPDRAERWLGLVEPRTSGRPGIVFYSASHGELLLLKRVLARLTELQPDVEPIILVPRPSVLALARERFPNLRSHCVTPLLPGTHARVLRRLTPELLAIVEFARIPLWVRAASRLSIPVAIINGRISRKHVRACRRWPWLLQPMIRACDKIYVQTSADAADFIRHGARPKAIEIGGALKYDSAALRRNPAAVRQIAELAAIGPSDRVLLGGSTTGDEEEVLARVFQQLAPHYPQLRLILVPRSRRRFARVARMLRSLGLRFQRRSQLERTGADPIARVLLVDSVGELAAWWGVAHIGFVGASLAHRGGHNMIEPAALGVATCFGPHTDDFRDVVAALVGYEAAVQVSDESQLRSFVRRCLDEPAYSSALGQRSQAVCRAKRGAIERTCQQLSAWLDDLRGPAILPFRAAAPAAKQPAQIRRAA